MHIAFVTSERSPFSKTGGLADVSAALPTALAALGLEVTVFSPLYRSAASALAARDLDVQDEAGPTLWIGDEQHTVHYRTLRHDGCRLVFVADDAFYDRPSLYVGADGGDYPDNVARFAFFCRAVLEYWLGRDQAPDVFHLNDWQTALIPIYLRTLYRHPLLATVHTLLTIHNLAYQGRYVAPQLYATGLDWGVYYPGGLEFYGGLNLLKSGLLHADALSTVSPSYAAEIQTPAFGNGLDGVLRSVAGKLTGILNGIDTARWDPAHDPLLPARFEAGDLQGKAVCKRTLQERTGLPTQAEAFVLGVISRFDVQKGMPLIADAMRFVASLPTQLVVLGSGDAELERRMQALAAALPWQVAVTIGFDDALAHLIEGGADTFLMPSVYEPCGLNQMYSQRYGTVPIVHATGGLKDTVVDADAAALAAGTASGFRFEQFDAAHFTLAILRAWRLYAESPAAWRRLQQTCMGLDHSWAASARAYAALYRRLAGG